MKLSHSKLNLILTCPMSYFLTYKQGISVRIEKSALEIGSAVHWGIEHNTEDLTGYLDELGEYRLVQYDYKKEQVLAESMVHGYLNHRDELFEKLLTDYDGKSKLQLIDEYHELSLVEPLKSYKYKDPHEFVGIIDLLLLTNKGFIVVDYKTSSQKPDWEKYLDQLYRYIYLLGQEFPDVPVYKIAIINLRKSTIRQKQNENYENYLMRLKREYEINDNELINYHEFDAGEIDKKLLDAYIDNLSRMCDFAQMIDENQIWFINYNNANSVYGKSQYWDLFYGTPDCEYLYKVKDPMWDDDLNTISEFRDCTKYDILSMKGHKILNHYKDFKKEIEDSSKVTFVDKVNDILDKYEIDPDLISKYIDEFQREEKTKLKEENHE